MKRSVLVVAGVALTAALLMPGMAVAGNGRAPDSAPGKAKQAARATQTDPAKAAGKEARAAAKVLKRSGAASIDSTGSDEPTGSAEPTASAEPTQAPRPGAKGRENALSRIQANIAKAEAKIAAGTKKQIPPGLLKVLAKFLGWLGIAPGDPGLPDDLPADSPQNPGDGSDNETSTPDPSGDESGTPVYDDSPARFAPGPIVDPAPDIP